MNARHAVKWSNASPLSSYTCYMLTQLHTKCIYYILIRSTKQFCIKKLWIHPRGSEMCLACIYGLWRCSEETLCDY